MDALGDRMFIHNNPFEILKKRDDLTGLEKIRQAMIMNQSNENQVELTMQAIPLLKNPQVLVKMLESNRKVLVPYWLELIEEGQKDGSIQTEYPREMAEFLVLLDFWMIPSVFPGDKEEIARRYQFIADTLEKIGLPLMNAETEALLALPYFDVNSHV